MSRKRVLLLGAVALAVGAVVVIWLFVPEPAPPPPPPPPPPAALPPKPPLQADADGRYVPGYRFAVGRFRFAGFSLHPDALVTFAQAASGTEESESCPDPAITAAAIRLRCEYPQVGIVTIEGRFLTRLATSRLDAPVVSAVVTVRSLSGEVLYSARDAFVWDSGR